MSKYCLIDEEQYRPGNLTGSTDAYKTRCHNYVDGLIQKYNPEAFIIMSGSELDIKTLHGEIIDYLIDFPIHVFSPAWPVNYVKPNWVTHHAFQSFDHVLAEQCLGNFMIFDTDKPTWFGNLPSWFGNLTPDLLYTCYNNQPRDYRQYTIDQLYANELMDKGIITAKYETVDQVGQPDYILGETWPFEHLPEGTKLVDEPGFVLNTTPEFNCQVFPKSYSRGAIDIVTESRIDKDEFYLSEKTHKSLLAHKPFLVVSCQGYHKWLEQERGVELYTELFDYSFDDEPDYKKRVDGIVANIKRLSEEYTTPEDYKRLWESCKQKASRNFMRHMDLMLSGKNTKVLNDFLGIETTDVENFSRDKRLNYIKVIRDGDEIDRYFDFNYRYIIPTQTGQYDWKKIVLMPTYLRYFPNYADSE
tara:strand:- start:670 stop:1917 length:1248 start_codon:yes stop_codon:yes gene_type:complete